MTATLIVPTGDAVDRCCDLLTASPAAAKLPAVPAPAAEAADVDDPLTDPSLPLVGATTSADPADELDASYEESGIDFFAPQPDSVGGEDGDGVGFDEMVWPPADATPASAPAEPVPGVSVVQAPVITAPATAPAAGPDADTDTGADPSLPAIAPLWNRILGQVVLCPPDPGQEPGQREKRLNELMVFLQLNPWVNSAEIVRRIYRGAATEKTVTQQVSLLRARLGNVRPGGPKALPPMRDGGYHLDSAVRSDWMEFDRLVEILIETTPTSQLIAAMTLVTGPPLGGITPKEWAWTTDLREEMRDRVAGAAVVLARRHYDAKKFSDALEIARKGLWYDTMRQDLWQVSLQAALDGRDHEAFKALRGQYLNAVAGPDRDRAVLELTKQAG